MLLAEDPATLIRHTIDNFNIGPDKSAVERVDESLSTLRQARDLRLREASSSLQRLARQLSTISQRHEELLATQTTGAHAAASDHAALDSEKFRTAKAASDAEAEAEKAALKAADLAARLQELDLQGVEGDVGAAAAARKDYVDDEVLLRLKVYRSLGIDLERDGDGDSGGEWTRAVIRNDRKGDVHVVNIEKKFSRFFYANYFWKTL